MRTVCVFAASSGQSGPEYVHDARTLGQILAQNKIEVKYGGGAIGLMGAIADGALSEQGYVHGVLPEFMKDLEWGHPGINKMTVVPDMRTRKHLMVEDVDGVIALPGGCGTFEELLEVITLKRLGLFIKPIVLLSTRNFFAPFQEMMNLCVRERFMDSRHLDMWRIVSTPEEALPALMNPPQWSEAARSFAVVR